MLCWIVRMFIFQRFENFQKYDTKFNIFHKLPSAKICQFKFRINLKKKHPINVIPWFHSIIKIYHFNFMVIWLISTRYNIVVSIFFHHFATILMLCTYKIIICLYSLRTILWRNAGKVFSSNFRLTFHLIENSCELFLYCKLFNRYKKIFLLI